MFHKDTRYIVGYIRTSPSNNTSCIIQKNMIQTFCNHNNLQCDYLYIDNGTFQKEQTEELNKSNHTTIMDFLPRRWQLMFPQWKNLLLRILHNEIACILVDTKLRLYNTIEQKELLERLCNNNSVTIIEVSNLDFPLETTTPIIVYHSANTPNKRTKVPLHDIDTLYQFASQLFDSWELQLYLDLNCYNHNNLNKLQQRNDIKIIVVKSLFHLNRKILSTIKIAQNYPSLEIISMTEGILKVISGRNSLLLQQPLKVAIYNKHRSKAEKINDTLLMDKFKAFVRLNTNWTISDIYFDDTFGNKLGNWDALIQNKSSYDIVLVDSFAKFNDTIHFLKKLFTQLNKPIYSLKEGEIQFYERY